MLRPVVLTGPSGAGKSSMLKKLLSDFPHVFQLSVSHTTRKPREGEEDGKDYFFTTRDKMESLIADKQFIETAIFGDNMYGTSKMAVQSILDSNHIPVLDIEMQGCESLKAMPEFEAKFISLLPPSREALIERLGGRGTESEDSFNKRVATFDDAIAYGKDETKFDFIVVNDKLEDAYKQIVDALKEDIDMAESLLGDK
eukprot:m.153425 g.153425  ORF g.153425 m.153425 type:complete len:199 (+) comp13308_c0_seq1:50-646(+)